MGTNCALLLVDVFLFSYEAEFVQYSFILSGDVPSINNPNCANRIPLQNMKILKW
jgi:hypothetical protein